MKIHKSCLKIEKFIENQIFELCANVNSAIAIRFYQKSVLTTAFGWGLFSSGAYFREGLFSREYGINIAYRDIPKVRYLPYPTEYELQKSP